MSTESYALAEATPSITRMLASVRTTALDKGDSVDRWRDAMVLGGWEPLGGSPGEITVQINVFKMPVRSPEVPEEDKQPGTAVCAQAPAITVTEPGGQPEKVWGWDSGIYKEPPCPYFEYGLTQGQTFESFRAAVAEALGMGFTSVFLGSGIVEVTYKAPEPGPGGNGTRLGGWAGGTVWYGGWTMRSGMYRGHWLSVNSSEGPGTLASNWFCMNFDVRLHWHLMDLVGTPGHTFQLGLSTKWGPSAPPPPYSGPRSIGPAEPGGPADPGNTGNNEAWYRICVCPYQFAMWLDGSHDVNPGPGPRSLFVSMPWVPEDYTGHTAFVFGANKLTGAFRGNLMWQAFVQFDGGLWSADSFERVIIPVMRTRIMTVGQPDRLTNTQGALLADNAYVCSRRTDHGGVGDNRIAGKLWNCCVVHNSYPVSTLFADMMDAQWVHVSSEQYYPDYSVIGGLPAHGAQRASVWWKAAFTE